MATNLVTTNLRVENARNFANSVIQNNIYLFAGSPVTWFADIIPQPYDDVYDTVIDVYRNMLFGKYLGSNDVIQVIPNYQYVPSTIYAMYDDADPLLFTKQFYTIVNATSYFHVFKCLSNNNDSPSTIPPNFADIDARDAAYFTSDNYCWKYMYSVDSATVSKFSTTSWFPLLPNNNVTQAAVLGSIDVIQTLSGGNGYSNYLNGTFTINDIRLNGNDYTYAVNAYGSPYADFYNDCIIYIAADPYGNSAGEYSKILNYAVNSTTKWIQLETPFQNVPQNGAQYLIYPSVLIQGSGTETNTAVAWAVVNSLTNSISYTQVLYPGSGYQYASANVVSSDVVGIVTQANLYPVYPPPGGHGSHVDQELGATAICLSGLFNQTENNTIFANCDYQRIGLIKNPMFANLAITLVSNSTFYIVGEPVYDVDVINIQATGQVTVGTQSIYAPDADFLNQLDAGQNIVLTDGTNYQFNQVSFVTNSSTITVANSLFTTTNTLLIYIANLVSTGIVIDVSLTGINVDKATAPMNINDYIIGGISGAFGKIGAVFRSGIEKNFNTFIGCSQYSGSIIQGTFTPNEQVSDITSIAPANGWFASISLSNTLMYLINTYGIVSTGDILQGTTSGAKFLVSGYYEPEIIFEGGEILYMENFSSINRQTAASEVFKVICVF